MQSNTRTSKTIHFPQGATKAEQAPSIQSLWERQAQLLEFHKMPHHLQEVMKSMFFAGYATCQEICMDLATLSADEAVKVISRHHQEVADLAKANAERTMESLTKMTQDLVNRSSH
jgi:hypothetical protein